MNNNYKLFFSFIIAQIKGNKLFSGFKREIKLYNGSGKIRTWTKNFDLKF